jgi:hypothetical protein
MTATTELVVPKSIPTAFAITYYLLPADYFLVSNEAASFMPIIPSAKKYNFLYRSDLFSYINECIVNGAELDHSNTTYWAILS